MHADKWPSCCFSSGREACAPMTWHVPAPAQDAGNVLGGLALANLDGVGAQIDGVPTQLEEALSFCTLS